MLNAALSGELLNVEFTIDPVFGFQMPWSCPGVPDDVLNPSLAWPSEEAYMERYRELASRFIDNFKKYAQECSQDVQSAGPHLHS
jgi:phosphoenolpyruvate carboxykinase (ATP)